MLGYVQRWTETMNDDGVEVYRFKYSVFTVDARFIDQVLVVKTGIRTSVTPIDKLRSLYVDAPRHRDHAELILAFTGRKGRLKRVRIFGDQGQPEFERLVKALLQRRPDTDIRHLTVDQAYSHMGSKQMEKVVIPVLLSLALAAAVLLFMPLILHGLDDGQLRTTPSALAAKSEFQSRNVVLEGGKLLVSKGVREASTSESRIGLTSAWLPVVDQDWQSDHPVEVVLLLRHVSAEAMDEVGRATILEGVLRNIWWEGLDEKRRQELVGHGLVMSSAPLLLEWGKRGREDGFIALFLLGILGLILAGLGYGLLRKTAHIKQARKQADRPSPWLRQ